MTITQLTTFLKIAKTGNFTAAANELGYAQSTVTTQIKLLEDELGCLLFERLGKTTVVTPEGERLLAYAEKMLQLEREIHMDIIEGDEPSGVLKLGVSESLCYNVLPELLMEYKKRFPKVELRLQFIMHDTFPDLLKSGGLDLVYTLNPLTEDDNLRMLIKRRETLGFYAAPTHELGRRKILEEHLDGVPLLLTSHNCSFRKMLLDDLSAHGVTPKIALETTSKEVLKQFAVNGLGVAFIPEMVTKKETADGTLVKLKWAGAKFPIYSQVLVHKDKRISKAIEGFWQMVQEGEK